MEQSKNNPCIFRKVVGDRVVLVVAVFVYDIAVSGIDEECELLRKALTKKSPTINLLIGELSWSTCCSFKRDWDNGTMVVAHSTLNRKTNGAFRRAEVLPYPCDSICRSRAEQEG